jgi:NAD(P)-dependent dehydrogenase (short-subunit alcohol dehydrogenase family)
MSRVVLVTGAASGIGLGLAEHFLGASDRVVAFDRDAEGLGKLARKGRDGTLVTVIGDVGAAADVEACVAEAERRSGPVDLLINNAGTTGGPKATTVHETSVADLDLVLSVNIRGPFLMCRRVLPSMAARGRGIIVNIASVAGLVAFPGRAAYSVTKGAIIQLTRSITVDYGRHGIRAVSLCPGMIDTPLTHWRLSDPALREEVLARIPQRAIGSIADVVAAVKFLASDEAAYFNGGAVPMDGGYLAI